MPSTPPRDLTSCPRCGKPVSADLLQRLRGSCPDCLASFAAEDETPEFPNLEIQGLLGKGGMGVVYRAMQPALRRPVALKILSPRLANSPESTARFNREAMAMARLSHPGIVAVYEFGVHGEIPYLVMELVESASLREALTSGPLAPERAVEVARQLLDALEYAHAHGIVHRDLKPENVLLGRDGRAKLADFGLAKLADPDAPPLTHAGARVGTPTYMAPEQLEDAASVDPRADLYAVGVMLYEMLTGKLPTGPFPAPSSVRPEARKLDSVVLRLLEKDPGRRFESARDAKAALPSGALRSRRRWPFVAAGTAALALAGLLALRAPKPPAPPAPAEAPTRWVELGASATGGGVSATPGGSYRPSVCLDREGRPVVAWREEAKGNGEIYLKRWTGKEWSEIGGSATGGGISRTRGNSREPSLALDPEDRPMVAWFDDTEGNYEVYVRRWTGTAWEGLGGSAEGGGVSLSRGGSVHPSLAVGSDGFPVVVWYEILAGAKREIYAQRWNGALWTDLGGSAAGGGLSRTPGESMAPALVLDSANRPAVVWSDDTSGNFEVYFKRWDGRSWAELGGSATGGGVSRTPGHSSSTFAGLALDAQDRPVIAWDEGQGVTRQIFLRRWSGSAWEDLGGSGEGTGISGSRGICHHASLALDSAGHPTVSWQEGPTEIRFARWTGSGWVDRGVVGQSGNPSAKVYPFLRMDREDRPIVAWESWVSSNVEIHLRRRESLPPAAR